jgi:aryl-alcohol dehydrogenase-like predicted oxidoreductase
MTALPSFTLGTWPMSGDGNYGEIDRTLAIQTIHAALDAGVNHFDTAPGYGQGHAEGLLGEALAGRRDRAIVTTKFGVLPGRGRNSSRASILTEIDESLARLRTDYVDYYVGHWPDQHTPLEETMDTLDGLVRAGKARHVGLANYTVDLVRQCQAFRRVDAVQVGYSLFDRRMESGLFPHCLEHGIVVMAYGPLVHGLLIDGIREDTTYAATDWRAKGFAIGQPIFAPGNFRQNVRVVHRLRDEVARPRGLTVSQLAMSWVLSHPAVTTVLIGARTPAELHEDIVAPSGLTEQERVTIDEIMKGAVGRVDVFRPYNKGHEDWSR